MRNFPHIYLIIGIAILAMFMPALLPASTQYFQGIVAANATWGVADTLQITGNVSVNDGVTLTILPGAKIIFQGHYSLSINGRLLAVGNASNKITFTANNHTTGWDRIRFDNTPATNDSSKIVHCKLEYGRANVSSDEEYGGAIYVYSVDKILISDCLFQNNSATASGGAIATFGGSNIKIVNSIFTQNNAVVGGGAIKASSNVLLKNLLIYSNSTDNYQQGGGIQLSGALPTILNCTITNNTECGVKVVNSSQAVFRNCLIYGNESYDVNIYSGITSVNPNFYYCDIEGGLADLLSMGSSNPGGYTGDFLYSINANPQFVGYGLNPYDLQVTSPCLNTGDPATTLGTIGLYDIGGGSRIYNGRIDMGAYEELKPAATIPGNCLEFEGAGDSVTGFGISTSLSAFTLEAWVYHNSMPTGVIQRYITLAPEVAVLRYDGTGTGHYRSLHFYLKKANGSLYGIIADSMLVTGEWMHVAGTYDGTNMKLYLNGVLVKSAAPGGGLYAPAGTFTFGSSGEAFTGKMDEVRIWDYARTETQIREYMHVPLNGGETGLRNYWQFNENSGTNVMDITSGCNGTLNNMSDSDWINSSIPFGSGVVNTQPEGAGTITFPGVGLTLGFTTYGTASITATKLNCLPNNLPENADALLDSQYWIVERYGTGTYNTNMELFPAEDLTSNDQTHPNQIKLFTREGNSDGEWILITSAYTIDAALNKARFTGIGSFCQFLIARIGIQIDSVNGNALAFDGTNDYVNLGNATSLALSNIVTIEAWIKPNNLTGRQGIFSTRFSNPAGSFQLEVGIGGGGTNRVAVSGISTWVAQTGDNAITPGVWNHIAYVRSGSGAGMHKIYVNGVQQTLISDSDYSFIQNYGDKALGSGTDGGQLFNGLIEEVRVWGVARNADEIRETMYLPLTGSENGIISYWQCNETSGSKLKDGITSNNGTLVSMDDSAWVSSTIPFSLGVANSQNQASGVVNFPGTGSSMNFEFQDASRVTVTRLDSAPSELPVCDVLFDNQYWIVNPYGTSYFRASLTLCPEEDLSPYAGHAQDFGLYSRTNVSDGEWSLYRGGTSLDIETNTITFNDIDAGGQFLITYEQPLYLVAPQNLQIVKNGANVHLSWDVVPNANTYFVYASHDPYADWENWWAIAVRHPATNWDVPIEDRAEYYRVVASDQNIILEKK